MRVPREAGNGLAKVTVSCSDWTVAPVSPLTLEVPVVVLPRRHAAEIKGIKSIDGKFETSIKFVNRSKQTINVHWLDYEGHRQFKATVKVGDSYEPRRTFLSHPWLITDADDNAWYVHLPDAQARTVEILEPAALALEAKERTQAK